MADGTPRSGPRQCFRSRSGPRSAAQVRICVNGDVAWENRRAYLAERATIPRQLSFAWRIRITASFCRSTQQGTREILGGTGPTAAGCRCCCSSPASVAFNFDTFNLIAHFVSCAAPLRVKAERIGPFVHKQIVRGQDSCPGLVYASSTIDKAGSQRRQSRCHVRTHARGR